MDDLISRQAVMKEFSDFVRSSNNSDFAKTPTWNDAVSLVGSMPSAQQWIPCGERLPIPNGVLATEHVYYLVQNEYGDMMVATFIQFHGGARVWQQMYQYGAIMEDIVAWRPLPEQWRGEEG